MSDVYTLQQLRATRLREEISRLGARELSDRDQYARDLAAIDRDEAQRAAMRGLNRKQRRTLLAQQRRAKGGGT